MSLQPHQQRVIDEMSELAIKVDALSEFFMTDVFDGLPQPERVRMASQWFHMVGYRNMLEARIAAF